MSQFLESSSNILSKLQPIFGELIQDPTIEISTKYWMSFPEIGLFYDPEHWNFGKNFWWIFQDLPIGVNENFSVVDNSLGYALGQLDVDDIFDDDEEDNDDLMFESDLFDDEEDEDEDDSVNDLMNEIRILDLVDELDSRQL